MDWLLLLTVIVGMSAQSIAKKEYNKRLSGGRFIFSAAATVIAGLFFLFLGIDDFSYQSEMLIYSILFAVSFATATVCSFFAIANGPLSLTSLVTQYSLIIPTFYGLLFLDEKVGKWLVVGLILLFFSILFINFTKGGQKITLKWAIFAFLAFVGNGMCSTVQKVQQTAFDGAGKNEFMSVALFMAAVGMLVFVFISERKDAAVSIKKGALWMVLCGVANAVVNLFVMILSNSMPASIMFPLISAGGIIMSAAVSIFVYKEKLTPVQMIGLALGTASVIFLNL